MGIGIATPETALHVNGDIALGDGSTILPQGSYPYTVSRILISDIIEITGTLEDDSQTTLTLPEGWVEANTRVLCLEINGGGNLWSGISYAHDGSTICNSPNYVINDVSEDGRITINMYYISHQGRPFRILLMKVNTG